MPRATHRYTKSEYTDMVKIYEECQLNAEAALKKYREKYRGTRKCPGSVQVIEQAVQEFRDSNDSEPMMESDASEESDWLDEQSDDGMIPITISRKAACRSKVRKVKKTSVQPPCLRLTKAQMLTSDNPTRETYCRWVLSKVSEDPDFLFNVMWTGESSFTVNHARHPSNTYYWGREPPAAWPDLKVPASLQVWAAIHRNEIIGPIFIDGNLNATKFLDLLSGPIEDYIDQLQLDVRKQLWFQLNGLPAHSAPAVRKSLTKVFGEQWIGRYGPCKWPAKSADLSPLELFLWKFIKDETYAKRTKDCVEELKKRIIAAFDKLKHKVAKSNLLNEERNKVLKQCQISIKGDNRLRKKKK